MHSQSYYTCEGKRISKKKFYQKTKTTNVKRLKYNEILPYIKDNIVLLVGMSCSGKSTLAKYIKTKRPAVVVHLDDVLRKHAKTHPKGERIFRIYNGNKRYPDVIDYLITYLGVIINKAKKKNKLCIIEGGLFDKDIINTILGNKGTLFYVHPTSINIWKRNIQKRVKIDMEKRTYRTRIIWGNLTSDISNSNLNKLIAKVARQKMMDVSLDYDFFNKLCKYHIVLIN